MRIQDKYSCNDFNDLRGSIDGKNWGGGKEQEGGRKKRSTEGCCYLPQQGSCLR